MPSHKVHTYIDRILFGTAYPEIHRYMDSAYPYLHRRHRSLWHDPASALALAACAHPGDTNAQLSALWHIKTDEACSSNPALRAILELYADKNAQERKRARKRKK